MKFSCIQENLNQGLAVVSPIAAKSTNLPILNNILFKTEDKSLKLLTTNLEIGVSWVLRSKIEEEGEFTVQAKLFFDYINLLPAKQVDIQLINQEIEVACGTHHTKIKCLPASEFPLIPQINKGAPLICKVSALKKAIQQTIFSASYNETRPEISGIFFNFTQSETGNKLTLVGTDSYRLSEKTINMENKEKIEASNVIIPARTLQELLRIFSALKAAPDAGDTVEIYLSENQVLFVYNNVELISRLIEGQYPDYKQIIPTSSNTQAIFNREELVKAIKTASLFSKTEIYDINLNLKPGKAEKGTGTQGEATISSSNSQLGEETSSIEANITGGESHIAINYRYFLDGLANIDTEEVAFEMNDADSPCVVKPVATSEGKDSHLYIIMPIKQ